MSWECGDDERDLQILRNIHIPLCKLECSSTPEKIATIARIFELAGDYCAAENAFGFARLVLPEIAERHIYFAERPKRVSATLAKINARDIRKPLG